MTTQHSLLSVKEVVVEYASQSRSKPAFKALHEVSIDVRRAETVGLVGESGSGKTTLGRAILGLVPVTSGTVEFLGKDITRAGRAERKKLAGDLQVIFQDPYSSLNPSMSIADILSEPLTQAGQSQSEARQRIASLLDQVHLPADAADRLPREFSGGQRQRIAIARALALKPKLIVCDEPVSALDLSTQVRVLDLLIDIQEQTGVAYLFITHDLAAVRYISHRVAVMYRGRIVEEGPASTITSEPEHPYTQRLLLAAPVPEPAEQEKRRAERQRLLALQDEQRVQTSL